MIAGVFHRHPRKNSRDEFVENLKATLNKIKNRNEHIIICGDFNYNLLKYEHNKCINLKILNQANSLIANNNIRSFILEIKNNRCNLQYEASYIIIRNQMY